MRHVPRPSHRRPRTSMRERLPRRGDRDRDRRHARLAVRLRSGRVARHASRRADHLHHPHHAATRYDHQARARRRRTHCPGTRTPLSHLHDHVDAGRYRLAAGHAVFPCRTTRAGGCPAWHHRSGPEHLGLSPGASGLRMARAQDVAAFLAQPRGASVWIILRGTHRLHRRHLPQHRARDLVKPFAPHRRCLAASPAVYGSGNSCAWDHRRGFRCRGHHRQLVDLPGTGATVLEHGAHPDRLSAQRCADRHDVAGGAECDPGVLSSCPATSRGLSVLAGRRGIFVVDREPRCTAYPAQPIRRSSNIAQPPHCSICRPKEPC